MDNIELSVVVLTRDRPRHCRRLVFAVAGLLQEYHAEILLVNNGKPLNNIPTNIGNIPCRILQMASNIGVSARNKGWQAASGEYVLMLDDDIEISAGIINAIKSSFQNHPDAGITAFRVVNVEGDEESCLLPVVFHGCACAFRRAALEKCGGYPSGFGFYVEEYDLTFRILQQRYKVVFAESSGAVIHLREQKNRNLNQILRFLVRNNVYLCAARLPFGVCLAALKDIFERYFLVARKEKAVAGYVKGLLAAPLAFFRGMIKRDAFNTALFENVALVSPLREICGQIAEKSFDKVVICGVGRFPRLWLNVLKESGITNVVFLEDNICWINRKIQNAPVLTTSYLDAVSEKTAFITGLSSAGDNRKWAARLDDKGLKPCSFNIYCSLVYVD